MYSQFRKMNNREKKQLKRERNFVFDIWMDTLLSSDLKSIERSVMKRQFESENPELQDTPFDDFLNSWIAKNKGQIALTKFKVVVNRQNLAPSQFLYNVNRNARL